MFILKVYHTLILYLSWNWA